ncbi:MAG: helix-hairpin-helix domain-containing protein [Calditrichaeota bacterium]|nr:MAG: helix-hairpin-helix domain-containing protein [Calditrichota bacterium]MBL1205425.1 helix-hairpin-helix domain-containing protein [Calditrichota bacterium]NOG45254.1 helix-hairpin-helix domain-containing protein [Calditrichota bacterium]
MVSALLFVAFIIQWIQPYIVQDDLYDYSVQDSVFQKISSDTTGVTKEAAVPEYQEKKKSKKKKDIQLNELININTASQKELEKLPRIGPATAKNIINYRTANGTFKTIKEITKVKRIGPKTLEKIKPFITLGDSQ